MTNTLSLNGTWQLTFGPQTPDAPATPEALAQSDWPTIPAAVPGNVEIDLMAAGRLPDISKGNNIYLLRELETHRWWYRRLFDAPALSAGHRAELVFEGLDCIAVIFLNGVEIGRGDNMLIPQRFDVTDHLRPGQANDLAVRIDSPILEGRRHENEPIEWADRMHYESISVRKAPHMYGWDIVPRLISAGLWRPVHLDILPPTRLRSVYWATIAADAQRRTASAFVHWDFTTDRLSIDGMHVRITLRESGSGVPAAGPHGRKSA